MARKAEILGIRFQIWFCVSAALLALHLLRMRFDADTEDFSQVSDKESIPPTHGVTPVSNTEHGPLSAVFTGANSNQRAWADILQRLSDPDSAVRRQALEDLNGFELHPSHSVPVLISCLQDVDPGVRASAATQLGAHRMAAAEAVPQLKLIAFNDADDAVRSRAKDALYNIRFYDFSLDKVGTPVP